VSGEAGPAGRARDAGDPEGAGNTEDAAGVGGDRDDTGTLDGSPATEPSWAAQVRGLHRPGTLTALAGVFSTRGVSFDSLTTGAVDGDGDSGTIHVTFRATPRRARVLERAVTRLATVRSVVVQETTDRPASPHAHADR